MKCRQCVLPTLRWPCRPFSKGRGYVQGIPYFTWALLHPDDPMGPTLKRQASKHGCARSSTPSQSPASHQMAAVGTT